MKKQKVLLIGWDAADWKVIHELMDAGKMPTVAKMVENGTMGNLRTLTPVLSPMLWTSIATGKRPYKHGIYGFSEPAPDGKSVQPMTNISRKCKAIWNILNQNDLRSLVVGWWPSHPVEPIDGVMVSDFFHRAPKAPGDEKPVLKNCVHPAELYQAIAELRVHPLELRPEHILPFIPHGQEIDQQTDNRVSVLMKMVVECVSIQAAATHLLETESWDFAAIYQDAIDHFCHGFMKYRAPQQTMVSDHDFKMYQHVVSAAYIFHDMMLARLIELAGDDATVILMSDHGFHPDHLRPQQLPVEPAGPAVEHRDYGIFLASGPGIKKDHIVHGANLLDVAPTILSVFGLPYGEDMDGKPLLDIFDAPPEVHTVPSWEDIPGSDGQHPQDMAMDPHESAEALEQLIALGYIERPDENSKKAVDRCVRELDYNLALSYMDAGMHGKAVDLLLPLYEKYPVEFRFGIQLANCLRATHRIEDLQQVVADLNSRWRVAAQAAREQLREFAELRKERRVQWLELKKIDDANQDDPEKPKLAQFAADGKPKLFEDAELHAVRGLQAIARGNPQSLDFLAATIAAANEDFEEALRCLEKAELTDSPNPGFQFQVGNVYLGLRRYADAKRAYGRALALDEYDPNALLGMCRVSIATGEIEHALKFGREAIGLKYRFPVAHFFLGKAKLCGGDVDTAIDSLNIAIEQNPNFPEAHRELADIYANSDADLCNQHNELAQQLIEQRAEQSGARAPIQFKPVTVEELQEHLPTFRVNPAADSDRFLRCLSQPPQRATQEHRDQIAPGDPVILVSGLPRSGTSMMMQMLAAGGVEPYTDRARQADESNPKGYFEADITKQLATYNAWLKECQGKAVKIVAPLLPYLPQALNYRVIYMQRNMSEILRSQTKMLQQLGQTGGDIDDERLAEVYRRQSHLAVNLLAMHQQPVLMLDYREVLADADVFSAQIATFLELTLDQSAMAAAVDPALHRQR